MKKIIFLVLVSLILVIADFAVAQRKPSVPAPYKCSFPRRSEEPRFHIGAMFVDLDESAKKEYGIDSGAVVAKVSHASPAEKAGLKAKDIILELEGEDVLDAREMRRLLQRIDEPKEISLKLLRAGKVLTVSMTPEQKESQTREQALSKTEIGARFNELDESLARYFKVAPHSGVLITEVKKDGPAGAAGIKSGDIATHVNQQPIKRPEDLENVLDELKTGESAQISVIREGKEANFKVEPEKQERTHGSGGQKDLLQNRERLQEVRKQVMEQYEEEMEQLRDELKSGASSREEVMERMRELKEQIQKEVQEELKKHKNENSETEDQKE